MQHAVEYLASQLSQNGLRDLPEQIVAAEHAPAVEERNEDQPDRSRKHHPSLLLIKASIGETSQKGRNKR